MALELLGKLAPRGAPAVLGAVERPVGDEAAGPDVRIAAVRALATLSLPHDGATPPPSLPY